MKQQFIPYSRDTDRATLESQRREDGIMRQPSQITQGTVVSTQPYTLQVPLYIKAKRLQTESRSLVNSNYELDYLKKFHEQKLQIREESEQFFRKFNLNFEKHLHSSPATKADTTRRHTTLMSARGTSARISTKIQTQPQVSERGGYKLAKFPFKRDRTESQPPILHEDTGLLGQGRLKSARVEKTRNVMGASGINTARTNQMGRGGFNNSLKELNQLRVVKKEAAATINVESSGDKGQSTIDRQLGGEADRKTTNFKLNINTSAFDLKQDSYHGLQTLRLSSQFKKQGSTHGQQGILVKSSLESQQATTRNPISNLGIRVSFSKNQNRSERQEDFHSKRQGNEDLCMLNPLEGLDGSKQPTGENSATNFASLRHPNRTGNVQQRYRRRIALQNTGAPTPRRSQNINVKAVSPFGNIKRLARNMEMQHTTPSNLRVKEQQSQTSEATNTALSRQRGAQKFGHSYKSFGSVHPTTDKPVGSSKKGSIDRPPSFAKFKRLVTEEGKTSRFAPQKNSKSMTTFETTEDDREADEIEALLKVKKTKAVNTQQLRDEIVEVMNSARTILKSPTGSRQGDNLAGSSSGVGRGKVSKQAEEPPAKIDPSEQPLTTPLFPITAVPGGPSGAAPTSPTGRPSIALLPTSIPPAIAVAQKKGVTMDSILPSEDVYLETTFMKKVQADLENINRKRHISRHQDIYEYCIELLGQYEEEYKEQEDQDLVNRLTKTQNKKLEFVRTFLQNPMDIDSKDLISIIETFEKTKEFSLTKDMVMRRAQNRSKRLQAEKRDVVISKFDKWTNYRKNKEEMYLKYKNLMFLKRRVITWIVLMKLKSMLPEMWSNYYAFRTLYRRHFSSIYISIKCKIFFHHVYCKYRGYTVEKRHRDQARIALTWNTLCLNTAYDSSLQAHRNIEKLLSDQIRISQTYDKFQHFMRCLKKLQKFIKKWLNIHSKRREYISDVIGNTLENLLAFYDMKKRQLKASTAINKKSVIGMSLDRAIKMSKQLTKIRDPDSVIQEIQHAETDDQGTPIMSPISQRTPVPLGLFRTQSSMIQSTKQRAKYLLELKKNLKLYYRRQLFVHLKAYNHYREQESQNKIEMLRCLSELINGQIDASNYESTKGQRRKSKMPMQFRNNLSFLDIIQHNQKHLEHRIEANSIELQRNLNRLRKMESQMENHRKKKAILLEKRKKQIAIMNQDPHQLYLSSGETSIMESSKVPISATQRGSKKMSRVQFASLPSSNPQSISETDPESSISSNLEQNDFISPLQFEELLQGMNADQGRIHGDFFSRATSNSTSFASEKVDTAIMHKKQALAQCREQDAQLRRKLSFNSILMQTMIKIHKQVNDRLYFYVIRLTWCRERIASINSELQKLNYDLFDSFPTTQKFQLSEKLYKEFITFSKCGVCDKRIVFSLKNLKPFEYDREFLERILKTTEEDEEPASHDVTLTFDQQSPDLSKKAKSPDQASMAHVEIKSLKRSSGTKNVRKSHILSHSVSRKQSSQNQSKKQLLRNEKKMKSDQSKSSRRVSNHNQTTTGNTGIPSKITSPEGRSPQTTHKLIMNIPEMNGTASQPNFNSNSDLTYDQSKLNLPRISLHFPRKVPGSSMPRDMSLIQNLVSEESGMTSSGSHTHISPNASRRMAKRRTLQDLQMIFYHQQAKVNYLSKLQEIFNSLKIDTQGVFRPTEDNEFQSIINTINTNINTGQHESSSNEITAHVFKLVQAQNMMKMGIKMKKVVDHFQEWKYRDQKRPANPTFKVNFNEIVKIIYNSAGFK